MSSDRAGSRPRVVLVTTPSSRRYADIDGSPLDGAANVTRVDWDDSMSDDERAKLLDAALSDTAAEAAVVAPWVIPWWVTFTEKRWSLAGRLRVIAGTFDNRFEGWLDVADAAERGVTVIDTSRSMTPTVAEFTLAMTLNLLRDIPAAVQVVREGEWLSTGWASAELVHGDLTGRRVGLAGFGSISRRYRELLGPFGCQVMVCDPFVTASELGTAGVESVRSLVDLASRSEIMVVGIPPTPATLGVISADVIDALPRGSMVLVVTRMAVIDQTALWRRAEAGEIRVAVDVFDPEPPPPDASFRSSPWVLPTPHIAGNVAYCHRRCFTTACADALAVLAGDEPRYRATPRDQQLYQGRLTAQA